MNERIELAEVQRSSLRDGEDSIDDTRERGGEPSVEEGAERDFDQGVKKGLMNFEEKDFLGVGRDCWEDEEELDGLRLMTGGSGGGGTDVSVGRMGSAASGPGDSSR